LIVIVQLLNSTRSLAIADKAPNASCQNYIHSTVNTNQQQPYTDRKTCRHSYTI